MPLLLDPWYIQVFLVYNYSCFQKYSFYFNVFRNILFFVGIIDCFCIYCVLCLKFSIFVFGNIGILVGFCLFLLLVLFFLNQLEVFL